ncbi:MAG TPA: cytochrome P450 [Sporichthyaceae bacterium]|jgi:cytochrome P450
MNSHSALQSWGRGGLDLNDPFPQFAEVRELAPVHKARLADGHEAWLILRYADAKQALNDPRFSKDMNKAMADDAEVVAEGLPGAALAQHVLTMDPPEHTRLRKLVAQAFTPARVETLRPRVQELVDELCDGLAKDGPEATVDLVARFAFPLPYTVICELLGIPESDRAPLGEAFIALFLPGTEDGPPAEAVAGSKHIIDYLNQVTAYKREHPANDLITALGEARDGSAKLTQRELCSTLFQLFVAGHDTTASLIGNGMAALLLHPEQLAMLKTDLSLVPAAIEEFLRYDAPVPHSTFRYAAVDTEIGGVTIPAGDQVLISIASANRDPARFADPDALDIGREDKRHVAFGHGIHFCLGAPLGRMEGQIAFTTLLTRFPDLRLAVEMSELHWGHGDGLVLRGLNELPVSPGRDQGRG